MGVKVVLKSLTVLLSALTISWCVERVQSQPSKAVSTGVVNHNYVKARGQQKLDLMEFLYADYATPTPTSTHDRCLLKGINLYSYWGGEKCLSWRRRREAQPCRHVTLANIKVFHSSPEMCPSTDRDFRGLPRCTASPSHPPVSPHSNNWVFFNASLVVGNKEKQLWISLNKDCGFCLELSEIYFILADLQCWLYLGKTKYFNSTCWCSLA